MPLKNCLDSAFDMSNFILNADGLIPIVITEKAPYGFRGGFVAEA
jgi:hypothetical protein